tara:strand:- start:1 stop:144 length:144 start_codon:yes stop_codon:yes gene_type:complete
MLSAIVNKGLRANFGLFAEMGATPLILMNSLGIETTRAFRLRVRLKS